MNIIPLQSQYLAETGTLIQSCIRASWNTFPQNVLDELCKKYTPTNMKERTKDHMIWIALEGETVVGTIALKEQQLKTFFVDFEHQGKGIGRKLFTALEEEVARRDYDAIWLTSSVWAEKIYEKLGFVAQETIQKERLGFQYVDIRMEKIYKKNYSG